MMQPFAFAILVLICFRLSELVTVDDGPGDVFLNLRIRAGCYELDEAGRVKTSWGRALVCPYCVGVWVALFLALGWFGVSANALWLWLAIAGGQALLESIGGRT